MVKNKFNNSKKAKKLIIKIAKKLYKKIRAKQKFKNF